MKIYHNIPKYTMFSYGISWLTTRCYALPCVVYGNVWYTMVYHGVSCMVNHDMLCFAMCCVWQCMVYHGLPRCIMVYLFKKTMLFYHGLPVSKRCGIPRVNHMLPLHNICQSMAFHDLQWSNMVYHDIP